MLKTFGFAIAVLLAIVLVLAASKPDTFQVKRTAAIKAPPEKIFVLINDFARWPAWSPYEKKDPSMKRTLSPQASGKGAVYEWDGDGNVGKGRMEIVESAPLSKVSINLDFIKPFEAHNVVDFTLAPQGETTTVTWGMHGPAPFVSKLMQVFLSMDDMVGKDFEAGLADLKAVAEK
jgi:uncharacterized protein YndB with AHSA1/START domain